MGELRQVNQREYKTFRYIEKTDAKSPLEFNPKRVILVGSGAIRNAWSPLHKLLRENPPIKLEEFATRQLFHQPDLASHVLANQSFMYRAIRNLALRRIEKGNLTKEDLTKIAENIEAYRSFRSNLAKYYNDAMTSEIQLQPEISVIKSYLDPLSTVTITTNWDDLLWRETSSFPNLVQLHGRITYPESLILPTELTTDDEVIKKMDFSSLINKHPADLRETIKNFIDTHVSRGIFAAELESAHNIAVHWLSSAEEIVIWGLGFNIYDSELNSIVSVANPPESPVKKITVIDTNKAKVRLVAALLAFPQEKIEFVRVKPRFWRT